jgi:hypothetical protein
VHLFGDARQLELDAQAAREQHRLVHVRAAQAFRCGRTIREPQCPDLRSQLRKRRARSSVQRLREQRAQAGDVEPQLLVLVLLHPLTLPGGNS